MLDFSKRKDSFMVAITGASGKLGKWVIHHLAKVIPPAEIVATVRKPEQCDDLRRLGVVLRPADYQKPETWASALAGVKKVLLISSSDLSTPRSEQHAAVIRAARAAHVEHLVYTSILKCDTSSLWLARDHLATERAIAESGLPSTILRNGWYLENHTENLKSALEYGVLHGCAKEGRFSSASREDYALAAVRVLTSPGHVGKTYELAGDSSFTLSELASEIGRRSSKTVTYQDHAFEDYRKLLTSFHLPEVVANMLADSDVGASRGDLQSDAKDMRELIGRPTTALRAALDRAIG